MEDGNPRKNVQEKDTLTVYYDDSRQNCREAAERFSGYDGVICRKASDYRQQQIIFAQGERIGLVFDSQNGKLHFAISHIIWKIAASKSKTHMIFVTGGKRELRALQTAREEMEQRGYHVENVYARYFFERSRVAPDGAVEQIVREMTEKRGNVPSVSGRRLAKKEVRRLLWTEKKLRKRLWEEHRQYQKYDRENTEESGNGKRKGKYQENGTEREKKED